MIRISTMKKAASYGNAHLNATEAVLQSEKDRNAKLLVRAQYLLDAAPYAVDALGILTDFVEAGEIEDPAIQRAVDKANRALEIMEKCP